MLQILVPIFLLICCMVMQCCKYWFREYIIEVREYIIEDPKKKLIRNIGGISKNIDKHKLGYKKLRISETLTK